MQNIKIPNRVGYDIARIAYLEVIYDSIKKLGSKYHIVHLEGYSDLKDRVQFTYGGKKCYLYAVGLPNLETGDFTIQVRAKNKDVLTLWELPVNVQDFRFKTLDRIAYEVYDYCKEEDDQEYEEVRKEYIAGGMDNYREFMS